MFSIKDKILVCDMSKFTLGIEISVIEGGAILSKTTAEDKEMAMSFVYTLCGLQDIKNVFIKTLSAENPKKIENDFKTFGQINFSEKVDKIHFHMI